MQFIKKVMEKTDLKIEILVHNEIEYKRLVLFEHGTKIVCTKLWATTDTSLPPLTPAHQELLEDLYEGMSQNNTNNLSTESLDA